MESNNSFSHIAIAFIFPFCDANIVFPITKDHCGSLSKVYMTILFLSSVNHMFLVLIIGIISHMRVVLHNSASGHFLMKYQM